jgi:hypothetical protein
MPKAVAVGETLNVIVPVMVPGHGTAAASSVAVTVFGTAGVPLNCVRYGAVSEHGPPGGIKEAGRVMVWPGSM